MADLRFRQWFTTTMVLATALTGPVAAQGKALILFAHGGRQIPITSLSDLGDELRPGWMGGGGLGLQVNPNVAIRGSISLTSSEYRGPTLEPEDNTFRRRFISVDVQTGLPTTSGWAPYLYVGGGSVQIEPLDSSLEQFSKFAAHFGAGTNYVFDNAFFALFLEVGSYLYDFSELGFSSYQFELQFLAGIAYALPL